MNHLIVQRGEVVVAESQDIVYRDAVSSDRSQQEIIEPTPVLLTPGEWSIDVTPTLLFRFSALTYNAHRIHYDRDYARLVEGYPGLVTHGPLQAMAMAELARATSPGPVVDSTFEYRLVSPLFDYQGLVAQVVTSPDAVTTSIRDNHGRKTAVGKLSRGS